MYGKFFVSTFTGSMFGAGPDVFALWGYVIAHAVEGAVEVNPAFVAAVLGTTEERVAEALGVLCRPDPRSRSDAEDGRRLVPESAYQYRVVNHARYRAMRNEEDRRVYNREAKKRERARVSTSTRVKPLVNDTRKMSNMSAAVSRGQPRSAHTEAEAEAEADTETRRTVAPAALAGTKPPADTKVFLVWFQTEYATRRKGAKYFVRWEKHAAIVKRLLHLHDLARLKTLAIVMLESNEEWIERTDRGVEVLSAKINWLEERLAAWEAARAEGGRAC